MWISGVIFLPGLVLACSPVCVTKCASYFAAAECAGLCGCEGPVGREDSRTVALCVGVEECGKAPSLALHLSCCSASLALLSAPNPFPFLMDPETQAIEYCQDSCRSFCAVLHTRTSADCYRLCSALFCVNPTPTGPVYTFSSEEDRRKDREDLVIWVLGALVMGGVVIVCGLKACERHMKTATGKSAKLIHSS